MFHIIQNYCFNLKKVRNVHNVPTECKIYIDFTCGDDAGIIVRLKDAETTQREYEHLCFLLKEYVKGE